MLTLILRNLPGIALGSALAASLMLIWSTAYVEPRAYRAGLEAARIESVQKSIELLRERAVTDETIGRMSDDDLCIALGGRVLADGRCE